MAHKPTNLAERKALNNLRTKAKPTTQQRAERRAEKARRIKVDRVFHRMVETDWL